MIGAGGIAVAAVAGKEILYILYKPEYAEYYQIFLWLMGATALSYIGTFLGYTVTATGRFWLQTPLTFLTVIVTIIACHLLVAHYGLLGVAFSEVDR